MIAGGLAPLLAGFALTLMLGQSFVPPGTVLRVLPGRITAIVGAKACG